MNVKEYKHYLTNNSLVVSLHLLLGRTVGVHLLVSGGAIIFLIGCFFSLNLLLFGSGHLAHASVLGLFVDLFHVVAGSEHLVLDHASNSTLDC